MRWSMNRIRLLAVAVGIALILSIGGIVMAQNAGNSAGTAAGSVNVSTSNQQVGIWVNGLGKVTVTPDVAVLQLGIEAQGATVGEAQTRAAEAMDRVIKALTGNGVAGKDIQTRFFNINRITRWDDKGQVEIVIGYRVSNMVTAKVRTVAKTGDVIDAVATAGGDLTRIDNITFTVDDPAAYTKDARDKAMADARTKAQQLATLGGVKLGKPTFISESSYYPYAGDVSVPVAAGSKAMEVATPVSPGELDITVNVQVTYAIND
jgi:uncharacterized protein YggE